MINLFHSLLLTAAILFCLSFLQQREDVNPRLNLIESNIAYLKSDTTKMSFPEDWLGYWEGELRIYKAEGIQQSIPMALDLSPTKDPNSYQWAIIYGEDTLAGRRDYILTKRDSKKGHYIIDEQNGIELDAYQIDNELISVFEVMGNSLTTTYRREEECILFEILMYNSDPISITGDTLITGQEIPAVKSYQPIVRQKARLLKKE